MTAADQIVRSAKKCCWGGVRDYLIHGIVPSFGTVSDHRWTIDFEELRRTDPELAARWGPKSRRRGACFCAFSHFCLWPLGSVRHPQDRLRRGPGPQGVGYHIKPRAACEKQILLPSFQARFPGISCGLGTIKLRSAPNSGRFARVKNVISYCLRSPKSIARNNSRMLFGRTAQSRFLSSLIRRGKIGHPFILFGAVGFGKTTLARLYAEALNCQRPDAEGSPSEELRALSSF